MPVPGGSSGIQVPAQYQPLLQQMSQATGIPYNVEAAQASLESNFVATAKSSAGAEGWLQFLPSTYNAYAAQAGVATGTEFNPQDESQVYDVYMASLLQQEGGSVYKALEAYNAGPGNLSAGAGYATQILQTAGASTSLTATPGQYTAQEASSASSNPFAGFFNQIFGSLGLGNPAGTTISPGKDLMIRLGLILMAGVILIIGINMIVNIKQGVGSGTKAAGTATEIAGAVTLQPEVVAAGATAKEAGKAIKSSGPSRGKSDQTVIRHPQTRHS